MREFQISENDAYQRVDRFITKVCPSLPLSLLYKYIRNKKIKVNKKRCTVSQRLQPGDQIQCYIKEEFFADSRKSYDFLSVSASLQIVYEDDQILVAYKQDNMLVQKDRADIQDNLNDRLLHYLYNKKEYDPSKELSFVPAFAHRLDRNTEGILVAGKTAEALRMLNEKLRSHEIAKYYLALVEGIPMQREADLFFYHKKDQDYNIAHLFDEPLADAKQIHTRYRVLETFGSNALLEVQLFTGKSHQIRASLAKLQHPLVGDRKYGAAVSPIFSHQALCAYKLHFAFCEDAGCLNYLKDKQIVLTDSRLQRFVKSLHEK